MPKDDRRNLSGARPEEPVDLDEDSVEPLAFEEVTPVEP